MCIRDRDKSGPIEIAFELSELLGYSPRDHSWVPETWRTTQVPAGYTWGFELVQDSSGHQVPLRYCAFRVADASVYVARVWLKDCLHPGTLDICMAQPADGPLS